MPVLWRRAAHAPVASHFSRSTSPVYAARGGRVSIIMNGSPLFTGDAGSGEQIRRWIWKTIGSRASLPPEQLFQHRVSPPNHWCWPTSGGGRRAGAAHRRHLLVACARAWGGKRREIPHDKARQIIRAVQAIARNIAKYTNSHFGYRKITVERPLRLNFQASPERIARLEEQRAFVNLAVSRKKKVSEKEKDEAAGRQLQDQIRQLLATLPQDLYRDRQSFLKVLKGATRQVDLKLTTPVRERSWPLSPCGMR